MHVCPFPEKPFLQLHLNEPLVLVQFAFVSQVWDPSVHSSASAITKIGTQSVHVSAPSLVTSGDQI